ncbi:nucleoside deaminase [Bdellovibrio sp. HCB2-146]|uniref:nucleoside deaminase n=1 Tax=Bdellovibrio sp. HCB2-146 TaxID=3394362 RepID=UPI0039BD4B67
MTQIHEYYLKMAVDLALKNAEKGGRPFGAVLVKDDQVLATGVNEILATNDPTCHAELSAIRQASQKLQSPRLEGCVIYASGQPCPMCLSAMYLTGIQEAYFAYSNADGEPYGLSTAPIYSELQKPLDQQKIQIRYMPLEQNASAHLYKQWKQISK